MILHLCTKNWSNRWSRLLLNCVIVVIVRKPFPFWSWWHGPWPHQLHFIEFDLYLMKLPISVPKIYRWSCLRVFCPETTKSKTSPQTLFVGYKGKNKNPCKVRESNTWKLCTTVWCVRRVSKVYATCCGNMSYWFTFWTNLKYKLYSSKVYANLDLRLESYKTNI